MERLLLDSNNLCASILKPDGLSAKLLELGLRHVYEPIILDTVVAEFINKCRVGMTKKRITFSDQEIDEFLDSLSPMLSQDNIKRVSIGRGYMLHRCDYKISIEEVLYKITQRNYEDLVRFMEPKLRTWPSKIDLNDLHVMVGAIEQECDAIVTMNVKDFPAKIGKIEVLTPIMAIEKYI